ncbi:MAG: hypothetical protein AAGK78_16970, partial [Planctomycetota bacterium]
VAEDFQRLDRISDYLENEEFSNANDVKGDFLDHGPSISSYAGERDGKLDAMNNTAARVGNLVDYLLDQWRLTDVCTPSPHDRHFDPNTPITEGDVCRAGEMLIGELDDRGYLTQSLEAVRDELLRRGRGSDVPPLVAFTQAHELIRRHLEPAGVGATSLQDCLLLQLDALERDDEFADGHDFELERSLVQTHLKDLELNRYPQIAKKTGRSIEQLQHAVRRLGRLHPHPGKLISPDEVQPITPDATIRYDEDSGEYTVDMARDAGSDLRIRQLYQKMLQQVSRKKLAEAKHEAMNGAKNGEAAVDGKPAIE